MKMTLIAAALALAASAALTQGYGYGPRGGYGPGHGPGAAMGYGPGWGPANANLSGEQREKVAAIQDEVRREHWDARDRMRAEMVKLRQMDAASPAYAEQAKKVAELREQMFKSREETRRRIDAVLK